MPYWPAYLLWATAGVLAVPPLHDVRVSLVFAEGLLSFFLYGLLRQVGVARSLALLAVAAWLAFPIGLLASMRSTYLASPSFSDATRRSYRFDLEQFADWLGGRRLEDVDLRMLSDYAAELGRRRPKLAPASIGRKLSSVRSLLRFALGPANVPDGSLAP